MSPYTCTSTWRDMLCRMANWAPGAPCTLLELPTIRWGPRVEVLGRRKMGGFLDGNT